MSSYRYADDHDRCSCSCYASRSFSRNDERTASEQGEERRHERKPYEQQSGERGQDRYASRQHGRDDESDEQESEEEQRHVHEVQGSVEIAEPEEEPHNHRFATVTGEAIPIGNGDHIHKVKFRTDFYEDHYHEFCGKTGGAIQVGDRHVHFLESVTTENDGHRHEFRVATLIDNPIGENS